MKILALEFSSPQRSVAVVLASEGSATRRQDAKPEIRHPDSGVNHALKTLPAFSPTDSISVGEVVETGHGNAMKPLSMAEEALKQAGLEREQIECLVVGLGPGSYTGIRAAIALAQGWQLARGVKLIGISSAECAAAQAQADGIIGRMNVVIDAQRGEFYLAGYEIGAHERREIAPLRLATQADVCEREKAGEGLIGPEVTRWFPDGHVVFPRAATLGRLALGQADFIAGEKLVPIYLRETKFVKAPPPRALPPFDTQP
jgi:tRNA threonylcarbamoyl adenosine modification protein YeaZ